ncbi:MAG: hypothetical protein ACFE94_14075 [Candidatus Hodarchaeota archaeon]
MGIMMVTTWYPMHKSMDVAKRYLKQPREIPFVTKWRVFNTAAGKDGMKQYHIFYTERGKFEEAGEGIYKYFLPFTTEIEGFYITVENLMGVSDSYRMIGLEWK